MKKRERNLNITLKIVIKSIRKRAKEEKRNKKELQNNQKTVNKIAVGTYPSITALNVNGLNAPIKRHRVVEWI